MTPSVPSASGSKRAHACACAGLCFYGSTPAIPIDSSAANGGFIGGFDDLPIPPGPSMPREVPIDSTDASGGFIEGFDDVMSVLCLARFLT